MKKVFIKKRKGSKKAKKILGVFIMLIGFSTFFYFFFPVLSFKIFYGAERALETPVPKYEIVGKKSGLKSLFAQGIANFSTNFYDARNWYPDVKTTGRASAPIYYLSIPKLKIDDAQVSTTDYDLSKHLIQYAGTSIPGENGNAIIFGHSTLPQWFDPKDYKSIFATLHTTRVGDEVDTRVNGVRYKFRIFSITVTEPDDTDMFSQNFDNSYLTIITCTPPGTVWKRLVVRAFLIGQNKQDLTFLNYGAD